MTITLFIPCFIDAMFPRVGISVVEVLERLGHKVIFAQELACCGQPAFNAGCWNESRPVAERVVDRLHDAEAVVVPSGSCAAMIKHFYAELLRDTPRAAAARAVADRTYEFADFLVNQLGVRDVGASFPARVTYHDGCHGLRELNVKSQPRELLRHVAGLELVEMTDAETCCGFGGTFATKFAAISTAMGEAKCEHALATGVDYVVSGDSSCLMQIDGLLKRQGRPLKTIHLAEVLASRPS